MTTKYIPSEKEKYMCEKQKTYFKKRLVEWKNGTNLPIESIKSGNVKLRFVLKDADIYSFKFA